MVSKWFTLSMHERSAMLPFIEEWRGKPFASKEEARKFDVESLIALPCMLSVVNYTKQDGSPSTKVKSAMPYNAKLGAALEIPATYTRFIDRPDWVEPDSEKPVSGAAAPVHPNVAAVRAAAPQQPVTPKPTPQLPAVSIEPITRDVLKKLDAHAVKVFGEVEADEKLEALAQKSFGVGLLQLTKDQGFLLNETLLTMKPALPEVGKKPKAYAPQPSALADGEPDVFADEDEPGFIPDDEARQGVLAGTDAAPAAYPAN